MNRLCYIFYLLKIFVVRFVKRTKDQTTNIIMYIWIILRPIFNYVRLKILASGMCACFLLDSLSLTSFSCVFFLFRLGELNKQICTYFWFGIFAIVYRRVAYLGTAKKMIKKCFKNLIWKNHVYFANKTVRGNFVWIIKRKNYIFVE